jgi:hypothetical protein
MDKERRSFERERSLEKKKSNREKVSHKGSPLEHIGSPHGSKGFCSYRTPRFYSRLDIKQDVHYTIKEMNGLNATDLQELYDSYYYDEVTKWCCCGYVPVVDTILQ